MKRLKKKLKKNNGLTLVALIITVIVMLIIAGITVTALTGDNGIINSAENADSEKNRSEEKETVEWAAAQSVADNDIGQVTSGNLEHYMDSYIGEDPDGVMDYEIDDGYHGIFLVEFKVSGNKYTVDENGMVYEGEELNRDGIELPESLILNVGESVKLQYTTESENVTWSNSDDNIAELGEDGLITGKANGHTIVTVTTDKNKTDRCYVTVQTEPEEVKVEPASSVIDLSSMNRTVQLTATILPNTANVYTNITWTSSDTNVATVNETGFVTGISNGTVTITAKAENGVAGTSTITVQTSPTGLNLNAVSAVLDRSHVPELQLEVVSYMPETANVGTNVTWVSSDTSVATVDETGFVRGIKNGNATITATTENGKTATCRIVVVTTITDIRLSSNREVLNDGDNINLTAYIKPDDGTCTEDVTWTTSDTSVVKLTTSGANNVTCNIQSLKAGVVTITAKNPNGKIKDTATLIVIPVMSNTNKEYSVKAYYERYSYQDCYNVTTNCRNEKVKECTNDNSTCRDECTTIMGCVQQNVRKEWNEKTQMYDDVFYCVKEEPREYCGTVCNSDCEYVTIEVCDTERKCDTKYAQRLVSDSNTITFKLSSYVDVSKLRLVKNGIGSVNVGNISVSDRNNATYRINISTDSTSFSTGALILMYESEGESQEVYRWTISCK